MFRRICLWLVFIFLASCGFKGCNDSHPTSQDGSPILTQVGQFPITRQMVQDRNKIIQASYPNETRNLGRQQLIKAFTDAQILINNGHKINDKVLREEKKRIDENTKAPEKLQEIKDIFGDRKKAYLKTYILPNYARRVIYYEFFLNDHEVQKESLEKARKFLNQVKMAPEKWDSLAEEMELVAQEAKVTLQWGFEFVREKRNEQPAKGAKIIDKSPKSAKQAQMKAQMEKQREKQASKTGKKWVNEIIKPLQDGEVVDRIINQGEGGWMIVRYLGPSKKQEDVYRLNAVIVPKKDFASWHRNEAQKVTVKNFDKSG